MKQSKVETADGAELAVSLRLTGHCDDGVLFVFSHAHTGQSSSFCELLECWQGNAVTWDRRGYGGSSRGRNYQLTQESDLAAVIGGVGGDRKIILVGIAAGAVASIGYALQFPHRVHGLILVNSFMGKPATFWTDVTGEKMPRGDAASRELSSEFRKGSRLKLWKQILKHNLARNAGEPPQKSVADMDKLTMIENLVIATGEHDLMFTPKMLAHAQSLLPHAHTDILAGVAHAAPNENPHGFGLWLDEIISRF